MFASRCGDWLVGWPPVDLHQRCKGKPAVSSHRRNGEESMPANTVIPIGDGALSTAVRRRLELELRLTHDVVKGYGSQWRGDLAWKDGVSVEKRSSEGHRGERGRRAQGTQRHFDGILHGRKSSRSFAGRLRIVSTQSLGGRCHLAQRCSLARACHETSLPPFSSPTR